MILNRRTLFLLISLSFAIALLAPRTAYAQELSPVEKDTGQALCMPERLKISRTNCLELGPTAYLRRMARLGITFPLQSLPAKAPDPLLAQIDIHYGQVVQRNAPVYASLEDAIQKKRSAIVRKIDSPLSYIAYADEAVVDGKRYYMLVDGGWMGSGDVSRIGAPSYFQGLEFRRTPSVSFGWILFEAHPQRTPGFKPAKYTGRVLYRYQVVQIYDVRKVDGMNWYLIGPEEWIPDTPEDQPWQRLVGRVIPNPKPPEGVTNGRWIEVNLEQQTFAVYDHSQMVYASLVASGIEPFFTRPGLFQIYQKLNATLMRGAFEADLSDAYYLEDVPWTMYYDKARALHGAYWHNAFGAVRSHGCVNMSVGDSRWLFDWAQVGDWVYVWDPSGKTPTDPSFYGDGGA